MLAAPVNLSARKNPTQIAENVRKIMLICRANFLQDLQEVSECYCCYYLVFITGETQGQLNELAGDLKARERRKRNVT